jgi:putative DNA primase/helicase
LNWAITGWRRLNERGYLDMPGSSADAVLQLEDLASPVGAFVRDHCIVAPGRTIEPIFSVQPARNPNKTNRS